MSPQASWIGEGTSRAKCSALRPAKNVGIVIRGPGVYASARAARASWGSVNGVSYGSSSCIDFRDLGGAFHIRFCGSMYHLPQAFYHTLFILFVKRRIRVGKLVTFAFCLPFAFLFC